MPALWPLEVANVLVLAERHKRLTMAATTRFIRFLEELPIEVDTQTTGRTFAGVLPLARSERLTAYDAAYLELAIREAAPLATQDQSLRRAANKLGVKFFEA